MLVIFLPCQLLGSEQILFYREEIEATATMLNQRLNSVQVNVSCMRYGSYLTYGNLLSQYRN